MISKMPYSEHPLISNTPGGMFNVSIYTIQNGGISQVSDPSFVKSIILNRTAAFGGDGFIKETSSGIAAGKVDQFTNLNNKK